MNNSVIKSFAIHSFREYGVRYCSGKQEPWGWTFKGSSNTEELQIILRSCIWIRRLKSEVLSQLPPKQRYAVCTSDAFCFPVNLPEFVGTFHLYIHCLQLSWLTISDLTHIRDFKKYLI